jgi:hypothetical protein
MCIHSFIDSMARNIPVVCAPVTYYGTRVYETVTEFVEVVIDHAYCVIDYVKAVIYPASCGIDLR